MGNVIEITTEQLQKDIETVESAVKFIMDAIGDLNDEINEMNTMWTGPANRAYNAQTQKDFEKINELMQSIKTFEKHMEYAHKQYENCEKNVAGEVAAIRI